MKLLTNTNSWSCILTSAAMVMGKHPDVLCELIGHDGSVVLFPELPDPACRRGFHVQEIIDCARAYGYAVTPIEARPVSTPNGKNFFEVDLGIKRFKLALKNASGIITGRARLWHHAVAWDRDMVYDPRGSVFTFDDCLMGIDTFWHFRKIKSF